MKTVIKVLRQPKILVVDGYAHIDHKWLHLLYCTAAGCAVQTEKTLEKTLVRIARASS